MTNENTETTGAVERAAEAIREHFDPTGTERGDVFALAEYETAARAALVAVLGVDKLARVDAETTRCSWSIPQDGHPYNESCLRKLDRIDGQVSHGACWDAPYARATAIRGALLGGQVRLMTVPHDGHEPKATCPACPHGRGGEGA